MSRSHTDCADSHRECPLSPEGLVKIRELIVTPIVETIIERIDETNRKLDDTNRKLDARNAEQDGKLTTLDLRTTANEAAIAEVKADTRKAWWLIGLIVLGFQWILTTFWVPAVEWIRKHL